MTSKVRSGFEIITDVLSRVSLVTSNIQGSSICSRKSLNKKTSDEILVELKAVVKTGALKIPEALTHPTPICYDLSAMTSVCQTASFHPHPVTTERKGEEGRNKNEHFELQRSQLNKNDCYIFFPLPSSLSISFSAGFFLYSTVRWSYGTI